MAHHRCALVALLRPPRLMQPVSFCLDAPNSWQGLSVNLGGFWPQNIRMEASNMAKKMKKNWRFG